MRLTTRCGTIALALLLALPISIPSANANGKWAFEAEHDSDRGRGGRDSYRDRDSRHRESKRVIILKKPQHRYRQRDRYGPTIIIPRERHLWGTRVIRRHGHRYHGYGFFYRDDDAFKWLAFTAITLKLLDNLNEEQQRLHEAAQIRATTAAPGERIIWEEGNASGSVITTRVGTSSAGRPCREFQQQVTIGGKTEQAYGTACRNPDGSWEIVP